MGRLITYRSGGLFNSRTGGLFSKLADRWALKSPAGQVGFNNQGFFWGGGGGGGRGRSALEVKIGRSGELGIHGKGGQVISIGRWPHPVTLYMC